MDLIPSLFPKHRKDEVGAFPLDEATRKIQNDVLSITIDSKTCSRKSPRRRGNPATLSRDIANKAVDLIQEDLKERGYPFVKREEYLLLEKQVSEQEKKVRVAQNNLTTYQRKNKLVAPQAQSAGGLQLYQSLSPAENRPRD